MGFDEGKEMIGKPKKINPDSPVHYLVIFPSPFPFPPYVPPTIHDPNTALTSRLDKLEEKRKGKVM